MATVAIPIRADASQAAREIDMLNAKINGVAKKGEASSSKRAEAAGALVGSLVAGATLATVAVGAMGTRTALTQAATMEQTQVAFEGLLGSGERAKVFIGDLEKFASSTPFEFSSLQQASRNLLNVGVSADRVIPLMRGIGDAAAGFGAGKDGIDRISTALQQMANKGSVSMEEINQLNEAGVPALQALAAQAGVTTEEMTKMIRGGDVSPDLMFKAFENYAGTSMQNVKGMMQKQSQTMQGQWDNLKDNVNTTLGKIGLTAAPGLARVIGMISENLPRAAEVVSEKVEKLHGWFKRVSENPQVRQFFHALGVIMKTIGGQLGDLSSNIGALLGGPLGKFLMGAIGGALIIVLMAIVGALAILNGILWTLGHPLEALKRVWGFVEGAVKQGIQVLKEEFNQWRNGLSSFGDWWGQKWGQVKNFFSEVWNAIVNWFRSRWAAIQFLAQQGVAYVVNKFQEIGQLPGKVRSWFDGVKQAMAEKINAAVQYVREMPGRIKQAFQDAGNWLKDAGKRVVQGLKDGLQAQWDKVKQWFKDITADIPKLKGPADVDSTLLVRNGQLIMGGLQQGLESKFADVRALLQGFTSTIPAVNLGAVSLSGAAVPVNQATPAGGSGGGSVITISPTFNAAEVDPQAFMEAQVRQVRSYIG